MDATTANVEETKTRQVKTDVLRDKLKRRTRVMQQVRTNTCNQQTIDELGDLNPQLQMQVVRQLKNVAVAPPAASSSDEKQTKSKANPTTKTKAKKRATTAAARRRTTVPEEPVVQSTEETTKSIRHARQQILVSAVEKELQNLLELAQTTDTSNEQSLQTLQEQANRGMDVASHAAADMLQMPDLGDRIKAKVHEWSAQSLPHKDMIRNFMADILQEHLKKSTKPSAYTFYHDDQGDQTPAVAVDGGGDTTASPQLPAT